jgi:two-component system, cell cycle response regulator
VSKKSTKPPQKARDANPSIHGGGRSEFETITEEVDGIPKLYDEDIEGSRTDQTAIMVPTSVRSALRPTLMALAGSVAGKVFPIQVDRFTIGRGRDASLCLADAGVSRLHCAIRRDERGRYFLDDLTSTNGTFLNGARVDTAELGASDRFQVGAEVVFQFSFFDAAEEGIVKQLYESATRDPLTRALNRRAFQDRLLAEISYAGRHRDGLVAILLDIDHFKSINDTYGHAAGDAVLRDVAAAISSTLRTEDVFARYGGEEFVLIGRGLSLSNGAKLAERIRALVESSEFVVSPYRLRVTLSAGVAELSEVQTDTLGDKLLQLADTRLYAAKGGGRNRVVFE